MLKYYRFRQSIVLHTCIYKKNISLSCLLLFMGFRGPLSKHAVTLVKYLVWVPLLPVCECRVLAIYVAKAPKHVGEIMM